MVWPSGCMCHAVRAPGVKWTLLAFRREVPDGVATGSIKTVLVNHSLGPAAVLTLPLLVICMVVLLKMLWATPEGTQLRNRCEYYLRTSGLLECRGCRDPFIA